MKKVLLGFALALAIFLAGGCYAQNSLNIKSRQALSTMLKGRALLINMDKRDGSSKTGWLSGKDLILVKLIPLPADKQGEPLQLQIIAIKQISDLTTSDYNQDGVIEQDEMVKANIALLRYPPTGEITITPLADSSIKQVRYRKNKDNTWYITLVSQDDKQYEGYFIDL